MKIFVLHISLVFFFQFEKVFAQASFTTIGNASASSAGCYILTPNLTWQQGTAWCNVPINFTQPLTIQYNLNFGNQNGGADGIAFVLQNQGTSVSGASGQGIGYQGINPSVVVEFDDFQNPGYADPANDHVAVTLNGDPDHTSPGNAGNPLATFPMDIEDGNWHSVQITWDPVAFQMQVSFDCQVVLTYTNDIVNNIFSGNPVGWWGFTSATGAAANLHQFCYDPPLALTINPANVACNAQCNGSAAVTNVSGGTAPYNYLWNNGQTGATVTGLCSGTYTVTVTSAAGCVTTDTVIITQPAALTGTITPADVSCFGGSNGAASLVASGGTQPYAYIWSNGATTSALTNLTAGTYSATVVDAAGCTQTVSCTIGQPPVLTGGITNSVNVTCFGGNNGSATAMGSGGTGSITYSWSTIPAQANASVSNLTAGNYTVTIADSNMCSITQSVTIAEPTALALTTSSTPTGCGVSTGTATASLSGGIMPYTYFWLTATVQSTNFVSGLGAGSYTVIAVDGNGCTTSQTELVASGTPITADFSFDPPVVDLTDPLTIFTDLSSAEAFTWSWDFGDPGSADNASVLQNPSHTYADTGTYCISLIVTDTSGMCKDTTVKCLRVESPFTFYIPNSFTPNGDGRNELFMGYGTYIKDFHLLIFDRWGNKIFESKDINAGWNGCVNNGEKAVQQDTYVWKVNLKNVQGAEYRYVGHVSVIK